MERGRDNDWDRESVCLYSKSSSCITNVSRQTTLKKKRT